MSGDGGALRRAMRARDPGEEHRTATPLELLFDLTFVVAVAQAAAGLHHELAEGHLGSGLGGYVAVFFAIWWAWMNFTWFASAYDTDDAPYRVLTLLQMGGVLVLAAGIEDALTDYDFTLVTIGYVVMRVALVCQWLRAAAEHPASRPATLRYAAGVALVQAGWVGRLWLPDDLAMIGFAALVVAELAVPLWAEARGRMTSWHPGHIAERYGLFTIIVLGEVILATLTGVRAVSSEHGFSAPVVLIAVGGLLLVFALWWLYFGGAGERLPSLRVALMWGYGHYLVFASIAAIGAGLEAALDVGEHHAHVSERAAALAVAVPVALFLLVLLPLQRLSGAGAAVHHLLIGTGAAAVVALGFAAPETGLGGAVLGMGLAAAAVVALCVAADHRRA
ncbi:low temperature requirement protein A [Actinomadura algeriensis]|uniref:Low temperature requirement protein LtrA n=1 Tax=Actinomadura algeriensis TaxID=1679523 RepID=A0ABR9JR82_9ACTN|nr:low temperature requirement protein A [Actinomadura algeriensis]MBE1532993.1 low temperature requirement protein LtrA [Actinomadura algeriensis]